MDPSGDNIINIKIETTSKESKCNIKEELLIMFEEECTICHGTIKLSSMTDSYYHEGKLEQYSEMLSFCFGVKSEELFESGDCFICQYCVERLRDAAQFRKQLEIAIDKIKRLFDESQGLSDEREYNDADNDDGEFFHSDFRETNEASKESFQNTIPIERTHTDMLSDRSIISDPKDAINFSPDIMSLEKAAIKYNIPQCILLRKVPIINDDKKVTDTKIGAVKSENKLAGGVKNSSGCVDVQRKRPNLPIKHKLNIRDNRPIRNISKLLVETKKKRQLELMDLVNSTDLVCRICNEEFKWNRYLKMHMSVHYPNHVCETCGHVTATRRQLLKHEETHSTRVWTCQQCPDKHYKTLNSLKVHIKVKHKGQVNLHRCPLCVERFANFARRRKHLVEVHGQPEDKYACKLCPKVFDSSGTLSSHVRYVHLKERKHPCPQCDRPFSSKRAVAMHMLSHSSETFFSCAYCGKRFKRKTTLTEHIKIHTGEKKHVCKVCGRAFTQGCTLRGHMAMHQRQAKTDKTE